ncbi:SAM-dependent methyltransferase [Actinorhabdospora filicis]|uniref:SAM-dependent methyltransferase n=1 Tax=Actinorhabdospora filicis TaxID=1785913 RepID=A0A9W6SNM7_9ACTN|nr:methyltransferase [Actinorhabdospora filicis]GLZ77906.1 SAM-dependent methyltransferase [Actinorhabdospora filicis]
MSSATASALPLMALATGFWSFKTLAAAHELDLFTRFTDGGCTAGELAAGLGIAERPAEMLLTGCASLGLLELHDGRYVNSPLAAEYLVRGRPYYFGGVVEMFDRRLYPAWGELTRAIRTNAPTSWEPSRQRHLFDGLDPLMLETFWAGMHSLSSVTARTLADVLAADPPVRLLDVGGGSGAYAIELCRRFPELRATVYDLPEVCAIAAENAAGIDRITTVPGDFLAPRPPLPGGHDTVLLSMILHDWDEPTCRRILRACHDALASGGRLLICELLVDDDKTGPAPAALMSLNMLVETGGRNYTAAEYIAWLIATGFTGAHVVPLDAPGANGVIVARKA